VRRIDLTGVMRRLYASEINCAVQSHWDAGFVVSIGDTLYGTPKASETFAADEPANAALWLDQEGGCGSPAISSPAISNVRH
jgi:hypothetical protein